jgi:NAD(P)-dependent dehydrogenase (short-subunit alcohol dehydrogenase family)
MVRAGWRVFATVRKPQDADSLRSEFRSDLVPVIIDVTDRHTIATAAQQVTSELRGRGLDALVNVAGVGMVRPVEYATQSDLQEIFEINVFGQIAVTQAFLPMLRLARGRIVNISSVGAHIAIPFGGLLNASKSAFGKLSDTMRLELRPFGIRVITIEPGAIATPAVHKTLGNIEKVINDLPASGAAQYGDMMSGFAHRAYSREMNGSSPDVVARAIQHALTAHQPHIRYVVGKHAGLLVTLPKLVPDWLLDLLVLGLAGLPTKRDAAAPERQVDFQKHAVSR